MSFFIDTGNDSTEVVSFKKDLLPEIETIRQSVRSRVTRQTAVETLTNDKIERFSTDLESILQNKRNRSTKFDSKIVLHDIKDDNTTRINKLLSNSVLNKPNFEFLHRVPASNVSDKKLKRARRFEREKTKGKKWFNLPAPEMTDEVKRDLEVLQMRSVLDPKHFYKKNDLKVLPKYFQIGKVMDSPLDYYNNRLTKKERKRTMVDELLADAEFNKYNKKKYLEIIEERRKINYKAHQKAKRLQRKNKK